MAVDPTTITTLRRLLGEARVVAPWLYGPARQAVDTGQLAGDGTVYDGSVSWAAISDADTAQVDAEGRLIAAAQAEEDRP